MEDIQRRTWAEIRLSRLEDNYHALRGLLPQGCRFMGMVKADAYGHGAVSVAQRLQALGADYLGVACLEEARELREAGSALPILILGYTPADCAPELLRLGLSQTVFDEDNAHTLSRAAAAAGGTVKIHVKVDTGMSRLGLLCDEAHLEESTLAVEQICALPGLEPEGIFTHFAAADSDEEYTMLQLTRFLTVLDKLEQAGVKFALRHCAASAAVLNYPCTHLDMVRPGIALYGHYPAPDMEHLCPLQPVLELKTRIAAIRELPAGTTVSYGRIRTLDRDSRLAVLPLGYGDGYFRLFSDRLSVLVHGARAPLRGRICMDLCMVDVTDIPQARQGDVVTVYGAEGDALQSVEEGADLVGTIQYELLCAVSRRVPRVYL